MKRILRKLVLSFLTYVPIISISFAAKAAVAADNFNDIDGLELVKNNNKFYRIDREILNNLNIDLENSKNLPEIEIILARNEKFYSGGSPSSCIAKELI